MISAKNTKHIWLAGGMISLLGTLPFGVLNILTFTIAAKESTSNALLFALGVVLSEIVVVACCLKWLNPLVSKSRIFEVLQLVMIGFIFYLAFQQISQIGSSVHRETGALSSDWPRFVLGLGLSAINPSQFPFWIAWNGILENKGMLQTKRNKKLYISGIGLGTFSGLLCFVVASQLFYVSSEFTHSAGYGIIMSIIFTITGCLMLFKTLKKHLKSK